MIAFAVKTEVELPSIEVFGIKCPVTELLCSRIYVHCVNTGCI